MSGLNSLQHKIAYCTDIILTLNKTQLNQNTLTKFKVVYTKDNYFIYSYVKGL